MIKCVHTEQHGERVVRVEYNHNVEEYRCRLFVYGEPRPQADYFTSDRDDAIGTAKRMVKAQQPGTTAIPAPTAEPKTVSIIPSWEAIVPVLVEVAANGQSAQARKEAMSELIRLAHTVDTHNEQARRARENPPLNYVIVYGNVVDGFTFVGPFDDRDEAVRYAEADGTPGRDWCIAELAAPADEHNQGE